MFIKKFTDYKTINTVIAIFGGLIAIALAIAPSTVSVIFNITYLSQDLGSWVNSSRVVWILCISISLLSSWARYIEEIYAQKIIMRFYSVMFIGFAVSNLFGGIESNVPIHSLSLAFIAVLFTSLVYAAVHFVRYPDLIIETNIGWLTGIEMMPDAFRRFQEWAIADYFLTLFIFGVLLGLLRLKHKNIAACIGMHTGIVMLIKIADYFTNRTDNTEFNYLVSPYNSTFGWLSFSVILLFTFFYFIKIRSKKNN